MDEKPIECSHCQNKATIIYKQIAQGKVETSHMCKECPFLKKKLLTEEPAAARGPRCSSCQTELIQGKNLGCPGCYDAFTAALIERLSQEGDIPISGAQAALHMGKKPKEGVQKGALSARLETLHLALGEAIAFENYEGAASLRDQIKDLMEKHHGAA